MLGRTVSGPFAVLIITIISEGNLTGVGSVWLDKDQCRSPPHPLPPPLFFLSRKFERGDRLCDRSVDVLLRMILCGRVTVFFFFFYFSRCETASEPSAAWLSRLAGWKTGLRPNELLERLTRRWAFCLSVCGKFISLSSPKPPQPLPCYLFSTLASLGWLVRMH